MVDFRVVQPRALVICREHSLRVSAKSGAAKNGGRVERTETLWRGGDVLVVWGRPAKGFVTE